MDKILLFAEIALPNDFQSTLIWVILSLVSAVAVMWRLYVAAMNKIEKNSKTQLDEIKKLMELRVEEKEKIIQQLLERSEKLQADKDKMILEIKPALEASNQIAESVLQIVRDAKRS